MAKLNLTKAQVIERYAPRIKNYRGEDITEKVFDVQVLSLAGNAGIDVSKIKKSAGTMTGDEYGEIRKAFTTSNSPTNSGLSAAVQIAYFDQTPLVNGMGRREADTPGKAVTVDVLVGIPTNPSNPLGRTSAGKRGSEITPKFINRTFALTTVGMESNAADEIIAQGADYFDALAVSGMSAFYGSKRAEELSVLTSNLSVDLVAPTGVTLSNAGTGGTIAAGTYNAYAVALTHEGKLMAEANAPALALVNTQAITNVNGFVYNINGGHSNKTAATATTTTTGTTSLIRVYCNPVPNAHWYAWYIGASGSETLQGFTGQSSATFTSLTTTNQNASAITTDLSMQLAGYAFDGLLSLATKESASYSYDYQMPIVAGKAQTLTNSNGQCVEINAVFSWAWTNWKTSPDVIWVSGREALALNGIYTTTGSSNNPQLLYTVDANNNEIKAGLNVAAILNVSANKLVQVKVHPDLMPGTIFMWTQNVGDYYQGTTINKANEIVWDKDWQQENFPRTERSQSTGAYANETLINKFPAGLMKISNIGDTNQI